MPMYDSNVLPDVSGRALGAPDKQWDGYFRNVAITGTLSGQGLSTSQIANSQPDVDSMNIESGIDANSLLLRLQLTNPGDEEVVFALKNLSMTLGGVNPADSLSCPVNVYSNATDTSNLLNIYQRGSLVNLALAIDSFGRIMSYANSYATSAFNVAKLGDAQARFTIDASGNLSWGAGGSNALDTFMVRTAASSLAVTNGGAGWGTLALGSMTINNAPGVAPMTVLNAVRVPNLNADLLDGTDWTAPPDIGSATPAQVFGTTLNATQQIKSTLNDGVTPPLSIASNVPVDVLTVKKASDLTIASSIINDGSGFKHKRVTIASLAAGAEVNVQVVWTTPFADGNYSPVVAVFDSGTSGGVQAGLRVKRITQQDATHIAVQVINDDTSAHVGVLVAHAVRG